MCVCVCVCEACVCRDQTSTQPTTFHNHRQDVGVKGGVRIVSLFLSLSLSRVFSCQRTVRVTRPRPVTYTESIEWDRLLCSFISVHALVRFTYLDTETGRTKRDEKDGKKGIHAVRNTVLV